MTRFSRRTFLKLTASGVAAAAASSALLPASRALAAEHSFEPKLPIEKDATLRLLRWNGYIKSDNLYWNKNTERFTQATGVPVEIQYLNWDEVPAKAALAAQIGSGPDMIMGWYDDPFIYPDKLVDVTDVAEELGDNNGGWYDAARDYGYSKKQGHWIAVPVGAPGNAIVHRKSWVQAAGFETVPEDLDNFLKLCQKLKKNGHPPGFALGHDVADANTWTHWLLWAFGGKQVDAENKVAINSKETSDALDYARGLHETMIPGVSAWSGSSNNRAFLGGKISLTQNGNSIWFVAQEQFPKLKDDVGNAANPVGPVGHPTTFNAVTQLFIYKYSAYPNAAKEYIRFMLMKENGAKWINAMKGYVTPGLKGYRDLSVWTENPNFTPFRDVLVGTHSDGYAGTLGSASATALHDLVIVDMFADACVNGLTPKAAAAKAEKKLRRIYS